jgi:hypothetical protein
MRRPFSIQDWLRPLPNWRRACWVADSISTSKDSVLELADDFGERVMARDFDRQVAELKARGSPEPLHAAWDSDDDRYAINPFGERGSPAITLFVQQSHVEHRVGYCIWYS